MNRRVNICNFGVIAPASTRGRREQVREPASLATSKAKGVWPQYPRDANIARNPAARPLPFSPLS